MKKDHPLLLEKIDLAIPDRSHHAVKVVGVMIAVQLFAKLRLMSSRVRNLAYFTDPNRMAAFDALRKRRGRPLFR